MKTTHEGGGGDR